MLLVDSLEQNIACLRQAFTQSTAGLHQVQSITEMLHKVLCTCSEPVNICMGESGWPKCVGMLGWFKWLRLLERSELACTAEACLFKV